MPVSLSPVSQLYVARGRVRRVVIQCYMHCDTTQRGALQENTVH